MHKISSKHMLASSGHWNGLLIMQVQTERQEVKGPTTNLGWRSLRSPPRVLQTPLEETGEGQEHEHNRRMTGDANYTSKAKV